MGGTELRRLTLLDELHASVEEVASVKVQQQEAHDAALCLERNAAEEHALAWHINSEVVALRAEAEDRTARTIAAREHLESRLHQALQVPMEIRSELRQYEQDVADALAEEAKANNDT